MESLGHKRKANEIDDEYSLDKVWGIVTDAEKWYFMEFTRRSAETGESFGGIERNKKGKRIIELEAKNDKLEAEIAELRKGNTEIHDLRIKLSISDAEIVELKCKNAEFLRANEKYNERHDAENAKLKARIEELESEFGDRITKVEQKQTLNELRGASHNSSNNSSPSFNSVAVPEAITVPTNSAKRLNGKLLEEKDTDSFLLEAHKKIVSSEIKQRNKEKKLHAESVASSEQEVVKQSCQNSHKKKGVEKIAQVIIDRIQDDVKHQEPISSAKLFDKTSDAEYRTKKANEEEILYWVNFGKEFMVHFSELVENSNGKIREKKAKGIIYDEMLEHLVTIHEKRSKEMGIQLPKISHSSLTKRTQRSMKLVRIFEKIGIDKIKYLSTYSPNSISELTNDQIQEIIEASERRDNSAEQDDFPTPEISAGNLETSEKIMPEENSSLSADLEDYIKTLTGDFDDETAYWGTPYENEARVEKEEVNEVKGSPRVQSNDDVYFDEEVDHDSTPHPVEETNDDNDCSHNNDSEEEMPDDSDDDGYNGYGGYNEYD
ncbi:hypothetical protein GLOIN_2v1030212 [Rhizophagus clarus]|uniref:Uncharacterized protein n=1 Tax=Rhizophagus clarus TaxID=94130 RepID=A0A8H3QQU5_9GLOM|nr:hypothetical protein GLOIN_2v1030212 [Rhizophagus clarus]